MPGHKVFGLVADGKGYLSKPGITNQNPKLRSFLRFFDVPGFDETQSAGKINHPDM